VGWDKWRTDGATRAIGSASPFCTLPISADSRSFGRAGKVNWQAHLLEQAEEGSKGTLPSGSVILPAQFKAEGASRGKEDS
jgi:hypothetical protein